MHWQAGAGPAGPPRVDRWAESEDLSDFGAAERGGLRCAPPARRTSGPARARRAASTSWRNPVGAAERTGSPLAFQGVHFRRFGSLPAGPARWPLAPAIPPCRGRPHRCRGGRGSVTLPRHSRPDGCQRTTSSAAPARGGCSLCRERPGSFTFQSSESACRRGFAGTPRRGDLMAGVPQRDQLFQERDGRVRGSTPNDSARAEPNGQTSGETLAEKVRRLRGSGPDERPSRG